jgi:hypothetical protein
MNEAIAVQARAESSLAEIAAAIAAAHADCETALRDSVRHAIRVGELLIQVKTRLGHGNWLPWLSANCPFSERTAQTYMRMANNVAKLADSNPQRVADMSLRRAVKALGEPHEDSLPQVQRAWKLQDEWNVTHWELADTLAELRASGCGIRRIAKECEMSGKVVELFCKAASLYSDKDNRPDFSDAFGELCH